MEEFLPTTQGRQEKLVQLILPQLSSQMRLEFIPCILLPRWALPICEKKYDTVLWGPRSQSAPVGCTLLYVSGLYT